MKFRIPVFLFGIFLSSNLLNAQSELELITKTCMDYIDGTAKGNIEQVAQAFHKDLNLYHVKEDQLAVWSGEKYVAGVSPSNRIGRIVSIDFENDAAMAKIEIDMPKYKRIYTDYLMLLKFEGRWQIVHKSFTYRPYKE